MHSSTLILFTVGIITFFMSSYSTVSAVPAPQCSQSAMLNADTKYRQFCILLRQLANALETSEERELFEPIENGIKRKDVDHVFLRFGRPRM